MEDNNQSGDALPSVQVGAKVKTIVRKGSSLVAWCDSCLRYVGTIYVEGALHFEFHQCRHQAGPVRPVVGVAKVAA